VTQTGPCKYCDETGPVNDEAPCRLCESLEPLVDRGLEQGHLPILNVHAFGPIEGVSNEARHRCAVCGGEIAAGDEHPVHRNYHNPRIQFRGDLHFHPRCAAVWRVRATHG
jgi:hypothetical protein